MKSIYGFFGRWIANFYNNSENIGLAIIVTVVVLRVLISPMVNNYFKSPKLAKALQPRVDALSEKYAANPKYANSEIMDLMNTVRYPYFGSVWVVFFETVLCLLISKTVKLGTTYIEPLLRNGGKLNFRTFFIRDITVPASDIVKYSEFEDGGVLYILLPAAVVLVGYFTDKYMRANTLVERYSFDMIVLTVIGILAMTLSQSFALSYLVMQIGNIVHIAYCNKFTNVKLIDKELESKSAIKQVDKEIERQNRKR